MKKLHLICGMCGSDEFLKFHIDGKWICNYDGNEVPGVAITCDNCGTLTGLEEHITQDESKNLNS